jgi:hypothetical protein
MIYKYGKWVQPEFLQVRIALRMDDARVPVRRQLIGLSVDNQRFLQLTLLFMVESDRLI